MFIDLHNYVYCTVNVGIPITLHLYVIDETWRGKQKST